MPLTKRCSKCHQLKLVTKFDKQPTNSDGRHCHCKECRKTYKTEYIKRVRECHANPDHKKCRKCGKIKKLVEFHKGNSLYGRREACKGCTNKQNREYYLKNVDKEKTRGKRYRDRHPNKLREYHQAHQKEHKNNMLKKAFGITLDDYNKMFGKQNGCCLICGKHQTELKVTLNVDHCHSTGRV